jgi:hypothetical protein
MEVDPVEENERTKFFYPSIDPSKNDKVVYCVMTEATLGIISCRHDIMPDAVFILIDLNFTEFCV